MDKTFRTASGLDGRRWSLLWRVPMCADEVLDRKVPDLDPWTVLRRGWRKKRSKMVMDQHV